MLFGEDVATPLAWGVVLSTLIFVAALQAFGFIGGKSSSRVKGKQEEPLEEDDELSSLASLHQPVNTTGSCACGMTENGCGSCGPSDAALGDGCCGGGGDSCACMAGDATDGMSVASSVGPTGRAGMPKDEFRRWKKTHPEEWRAQRNEAVALKSGRQSPAMRAQQPKGEPLLILFGTQTGNSEQFAKEMQEEASERGFDGLAVDMQTFNVETLPRHKTVFFLLSTHTGGTPVPNAKQFFDAIVNKQRPQDWLRGVKFAVLGLGHSEYGENFCTPAVQLDRRLEELSGQRMHVVVKDDEARIKEEYERWKEQIWQDAQQANNMAVFGPGDESSSDESDAGSAFAGSDDEHDMEDLGNVIEGGKNENASKAPKQMVNDNLRKTLTKQGYRIVGSHSGVKLCRWTKSMLRGRGGCYKHTFYGISSYQCMESTPSLACANKCTFCWRHHKNPVGTSWRWETDDPQTLVDGFMANHRNMIKSMRTVPGVKPERLAEAETIRHCALSLVGEPIIYPHINKFLRLLHQNGISSFLVTNAQFPDKMDALVPCTQLYVSIDAPTPETLKAVDRPLFSDFWERFLASIDSLRRKGQRTVFRLTLVKEHNMTEVQQYAELVKRGKPEFIEIKGVTFCGGKRSEMSMNNVPWHDEVVAFGLDLASILDDYELCCEHAHSCCILLAQKKFKRGDEWWTWIDFDKFIQLSESGNPFSTEDYMVKTPEWAVFGKGIPGDGGFDPQETRIRRGDVRIAKGGGC